MTKVQLLEKVTEEDIIKKYLPDFTTLAKNYKSPFSPKDNKPSLSFFKSGEVIKFKSHNTDNHGDVFQFVADIKNIDCKNNFPAVVEAIAKDFQLNGFAKKQIKPAAVVTVNAKSEIHFEPTLSKELLQYFAQFKINAETLARYNVQQVAKHSFKSKAGKACVFDYRRQKKFVVCYTISDRIKLYIPELPGQEKSFGFKDQMANDIFGLQELENCERVFIAAGEKDCLALNSNGFRSVNFQSETVVPTVADIARLKAKAKQIFIVYDNDEAGQKASEKICKIHQLLPINLPEDVKDVALFFKTFDAKAFEKIIPQEKLVKETDDDIEIDEKEFWTIFHQAEKYLSHHYEIRFNTISLEHESRRIGEVEYKPLNENNLYVEMNKAGVKVGMDKLISILKSDFIPRFNPFLNYFSSLQPWDQERDYIGELARHLVCDEEDELIEQFTKWIVRALKCALVEGYYNKQAFIIVHSKQNSGKTTFCRFLCPPALQNYLAENISDDKDSKIAIAKNFLINLDELSSLAKHEINSLKALFSKDVINERLPYDRKNSIIHRVASFIGSTNMAEFLTDETGSVRWLCFEIKKIDWNYKNVIDINLVWGQAYQLYVDGYECEMTADDIHKNEIRNSKFQQLSAEAEMIPNYFAPANEANGVFFTSTDILLFLSTFTSIRLNKIMIGKAMPICGFKRVKDSISDRYGYYVNKLK